MTSAEATPRITAEFLETFQNKTVRILGKVVALRGETATIDAGGQVNVLLNRVSRSHIPLAPFKSYASHHECGSRQMRKEQLYLGIL